MDASLNDNKEILDDCSFKLQIMTYSFTKACNFIKNETLVEVFSCKFCENSKNTFFTEATVSPVCWFLFVSFQKALMKRFTTVL